MAKTQTKPTKITRRRERKTIPVEELVKLLYGRTLKLAEAEQLPDPGPAYPSERSANLFLIAFRRGTVRQLSELIGWAQGVDPKVVEHASKSLVEQQLGKPGLFKKENGR